jgi:hypothetical protein
MLHTHWPRLIDIGTRVPSRKISLRSVKTGQLSRAKLHHSFTNGGPDNGSRKIENGGRWYLPWP